MKKAFLGVAVFLMTGAARASDAVSTTNSFFPEQGEVKTGQGGAYAGQGHAPIGQGRIHVRQNILSSELPAALQADIKKDYKDYWITALSEEQRGKHSDYYMTVENADQVVELRSDDATSWEVTSATVKE